jgi:hypothetical protein
MRFRPSALAAPEPGEADGGLQLEELGALSLGNCDGLTIVLLGSGLIPSGIQQVARHSIQYLSFGYPLISGLDDPSSLSEAVPCFIRMPERCVGHSQ